MKLSHLLRSNIAAACFALAVCMAGPNLLAQSASEMPEESNRSRASWIAPPADDFRASALMSTARPNVVDLDLSFAPTLEFAYGFIYAVEQQSNGKFLVGGGFKSFNGFATSAIVRLNADRSIDTSFSAVVRGSIYRIAVLPDEKILIAGAFYSFNSTTSRFGIARLNPDGTLDPTFDTGTGPDNALRDMHIQPDGKILIVGDFLSVNGSSRVGLARLNANGSLDASFTSPVAPQFPTSGGPPLTGVSSVGVQPDGKVIIGGSIQFPGDLPSTRRWVLRLDADGIPDGSFSSPTMNSNPSELDIQPDGKIVLVGFFTTINSVGRSRIARLNASGTLDDTFNPGTGANLSTSFVRVLAAGNILVAGSFSTINGTPRGGVALLNPSGSLDGIFAPTGTTTGTVRAAIPSSNGGYLVGGSFVRFAGTDDRNSVVALNVDGSLDTGFVANSLLTATVRTFGLESSGKIIVGGSFNRLNGVATQGLIRLNTNGAPDGTFDTTAITSGSNLRFIFQADGKLLVMGSGIQINNGTPQTMVRLNANGTHDPTFTLGAVPQILIGVAAAVQPDGKIVYSYATNSTNPQMSSGITRLNSDGSIDPSFIGSFPNARFESLAVLANGQILAAGPFAFAYVNSQTNTSEPHTGVLRLNSDGTHDRTFRSGLTFEGSNVTAAYAMRLQADGKILLGGRLFIGGSASPVGVARLNPTGTIDGTFQTSTLSSVAGVAHVFSIDRTAESKLIIGGFFDTFGGGSRTNLVRLNIDGSIDPAFSASTDEAVRAIAVELNGSILIGGSFEKVNGVARTGIARLLTETPTQNRAPFDFDGDGKTDVGIFRPSVGEWWYRRSSDGVVPAFQFGASTDRIVPADYTGDGKTDVAIWRPSNGEWFILRSEDSSFYSAPFGAGGDIPASADYDADGKADLAVFRPSSATWFIQRTSDNGTTIQQFGANGDQPVVADYDGDGKADIAIYRPSVGEWWLNRSTAGVIAYGFGNSSDKAVPGDYTGDGKADVALWRPATGEWYILRSEDTSFYSAPFGTNGDTPAPGDYDGDGKYDVTVFRPSNATWYVQRTTAGTLIQQFGATGDTPIPNAFVR